MDIDLIDPEVCFSFLIAFSFVGSLSRASTLGVNPAQKVKRRRRSARKAQAGDTVAKVPILQEGSFSQFRHTMFADE